MLAVTSLWGHRRLWYYFIQLVFPQTRLKHAQGTVRDLVTVPISSSSDRPVREDELNNVPETEHTCLRQKTLFPM